ncbi:hypothetical protein MLD38_015786 [Melastoma candidum]|uniref:Uncharacterized protein n=1 Tax=Melastoma candidum TaxID=119954 RepID=A0ACB9RLH0_9MYRT|nr:hypothetical protein MLD38_015786 [Melastoma candidum]
MGGIVGDWGVVPGGGGRSHGLPFTGEAETVPCDLCGSWALLYCQADGAYLCGRCDGRVHGANFLAGRHVRCLLCNCCQKLTRRYVTGNSTDASRVNQVRNVPACSRRRLFLY